MIRLVLIGALVVFVLFIASFFFLPWYVPLTAAAVGMLGLIISGKFLLKSIFLLPFKAKGKVLAGASAKVNQVSKTDPPPRTEKEDDEESTPEPEIHREYYSVDLTISPKAPTGSFSLWEPGEIMLVRPETKNMDNDDACEVEGVEIFQDKVFVKDDGMKLPGPQRLRLLCAVTPGVKSLKVKYYFETFGVVRLP